MTPCMAVLRSKGRAERVAVTDTATEGFKVQLARDRQIGREPEEVRAFVVLFLHGERLPSSLAVGLRYDRRVHVSETSLVEEAVYSKGDLAPHPCDRTSKVCARAKMSDDSHHLIRVALLSQRVRLRKIVRVLNTGIIGVGPSVRVIAQVLFQWGNDRNRADDAAAGGVHLVGLVLAARRNDSASEGDGCSRVRFPALEELVPNGFVVLTDNLQVFSRRSIAKGDEAQRPFAALQPLCPNPALHNHGAILAGQLRGFPDALPDLQAASRGRKGCLGLAVKPYPCDAGDQAGGETESTATVACSLSPRSGAVAARYQR
mmetsp:Transcript_9823/g.24168  ORF Transcript_9823/g.24168 Transcript_9823/m.24168 type:complete len:317 (-) Transcript_9823:79-1029(-)